MALYEYKCEDCGATVDKLHKMGETPIYHCEHCDSEKPLIKSFAPSTAFSLKGSGWYATDFKN